MNTAEIVTVIIGILNSALSQAGKLLPIAGLAVTANSAYALRDALRGLNGRTVSGALCMALIGAFLISFIRFLDQHQIPGVLR